MPQICYNFLNAVTKRVGLNPILRESAVRCKPIVGAIRTWFLSGAEDKSATAECR